MGGKPSKGTRADRRLSENRTGPTRPTPKPAPAPRPPRK
jgi:hypothetical protein